MANLFSLLAIAIGSLLVLLGLLLIAPQVRVHQIKVYSPGSWLFRIGMLLIALAVVIMLTVEHPRELAQVGQLMGVTGIMGGIITAGHEWKQAHENNLPRWDWPRSLTLQMIIIGLVVLLLASAASA